jgi:hydroxypyruvate isomerase
MRVPSVNVSTLFRELPLLERFAAARAHGFTEVELWWPGELWLEGIIDAVEAAGVRVALLSLDPGNRHGLLADPHGGRRLAAGVAVALAAAPRLGCRRFYTLIGDRDPAWSLETQLGCVRERLAETAEATRAAGVELLVEPVNARDNGPQVLERAAEVAALLDRIPGTALLFDTYHQCGMPGSLTRVGHVHLGDFPCRVEPGAGTLDFRALPDCTLGLEYLATTATTAESFAAVARAGIPLPAAVGG